MRLRITASGWRTLKEPYATEAMVAAALKKKGKYLADSFDSSFTLLDSQQSYLLVHTYAERQGLILDDFQYRWASPVVEKEVMKLKTIISDSYCNKLSSFGVPELMAFTGSVYETNLSRVLIGAHQLTSLRGKCVYGREVFQAKASMESVLEVKESSKLPSDWATSFNLQDNICYTMPSPNSQSIGQSIDAFVIRGDVVFFLQATVASRHPVQLAGLISVFSTLQKLCPRVQACE